MREGEMPMYGAEGISAAQILLTSVMRRAWLEHVFWTRLLIISIIDGLGDTDATANRLMENPRHMANIFRRFYGDEAAAQIEELFREHLTIAADLVRALKQNDQALVEEKSQQWYQNADRLAESLAALNPNYNQEELQSMLYRHLDMTKQEAVNRMSQNYPADVALFDEIEQQAYDIADALTNGIVEEFQDYFRT